MTTKTTTTPEPTEKPPQPENKTQTQMGVPVGKLVEMSPSIANLAAALCKCQSQLNAAKADNPNVEYDSFYASLADCIEAAKKPLTDNGLSIVQLPYYVEKGTGVRTMLLHESGEYIISTLTLPPVRVDPQGIGICITYARRYSFSAMVGLSQKDDDANSVSQTPPKRGRGRPRKTPVKKSGRGPGRPPKKKPEPKTEIGTNPESLGGGAVVKVTDQNPRQGQIREVEPND